MATLFCLILLSCFFLVAWVIEKASDSANNYKIKRSPSQIIYKVGDRRIHAMTIGGEQWTS